MTAKSLVFVTSAEKQLRKLPKRIQIRAYKSLTRLKENPLVGIKLTGDLAGSFKLRLGDYRIVYDFHTKKRIIVVLKIEHRQGVYK